MILKYFLRLLLVSQIIFCSAHELRKKPKVYNALITTDENLISSRAYPVIQPVLHEPALPHFSPFSPYGYVSHPYFRVGGPIVPGFPSRSQIPFPFENTVFPPQIMGKPLEVQPEPMEERDDGKTESDSKSKENDSQTVSSMNSYTPLNKNGLSPYLYPIPHVRHISTPYAIPPHPYHLFPVIYEPQNGYQERYLPPYGVAHGPMAVTNGNEMAQEYEPDKNKLLDLLSKSRLDDNSNLNNNSKNRDTAVPDVPPPPIPSGAKKNSTSDPVRR